MFVVVLWFIFFLVFVLFFFFFFFQAEDGIRDADVTGVQTCALPISYSMRLHQAIGHVWQRKCRAIFGSPAGTMTGCGVNAAALWVAGEVQSVEIGRASCRERV